MKENETPATEAFIKYRLERLQRLKNGEAASDDEVLAFMLESGILNNNHIFTARFSLVQCPMFEIRFIPIYPNYVFSSSCSISM